MQTISEYLSAIEEPEDYFRGIGNSTLPNPYNILLFLRLSKKKLQQEAIHNRSHHRYVLVFNLETKGCIHINHLSIFLSPGQALLIHPYEFHHFNHLDSPKLRWLITTFELQGDYSLELLRHRVVDLSKNTIEMRNELLKQWHVCSQPAGHSELQDAQLQTALIRLLLCLKQDRQAASDDLPPESSSGLLQTVNRLMSELRGKIIVIADLAESLNLSESWLRTLFKETAGIPLGRYIQNYRLNLAMSLLRKSDLSIADIAEEASFGSPQAFSRTFKKETGQLPRGYRQQT